MLLKSITLVRTDQYLDVASSLLSRKLKRYNVIISESEEYLMNQVLSRMASKMRPRENRVLRDALNLAQKIVDKRTFICEAPKLLIPSTVTQSTRK